MSLNDAHDDSWTAVDATPEGTDGPTPPPSTPSASEAATIQKRLSLSQWLVNADLEKYAEKIIEATDAKKIDDLGLLTPSAVEQCVVDVGLKPVPAEKLRRAIAEIELRAVDSKLRPSGVDVQGPPTGAGVNDAPPTGTATVVIEPTLHEFEEAIAICIDRSGSMGTPFKEVTWYEENFVRGEERQAVTERPRMEAVKAMFYAFRDRIDSLGQAGSHQLGLLQFDNRVETLSGLSDDLNRFEAIVDDMKKGGQTAIFSAIEQVWFSADCHRIPSLPAAIRLPSSRLSRRRRCSRPSPRSHPRPTSASSPLPTATRTAACHPSAPSRRRARSAPSSTPSSWVTHPTPTCARSWRQRADSASRRVDALGCERS